MIEGIDVAGVPLFGLGQVEIRLLMWVDKWKIMAHVEPVRWIAARLVEATDQS